MSNVYEIGLYELSEYILAYDMLPRIKAEKEEVIQSLYDDCSPTTVKRNDLDMWVSTSVNVEDMAILIIDRKAEYDIKIQRYQGKAFIFEQAMNSLTDRECDVIQVYYFKRVNDLGLSADFFHQLLLEAERKLCSSICELKQDSHKMIRLAEKQQKIQHVQAWQQAN